MLASESYTEENNGQVVRDRSLHSAGTMAIFQIIPSACPASPMLHSHSHCHTEDKVLVQPSDRTGGLSFIVAQCCAMRSTLNTHHKFHYIIMALFATTSEKPFAVCRIRQFYWIASDVAAPANHINKTIRFYCLSICRQSLSVLSLLMH